MSGAPIRKLGVRHSQDNGVVRATHRRLHQWPDVVFILRFRHVDPRIAYIDLGIVAFELSRDENYPDATRVEAAFLEGVVGW